MNKLKQVEDKIKELVPEIMELKFGCEIQFEIPLMRAIWTSRIIDYLSTDDKIYVDHGKTMEVIPRMYIKKILGRPITLEDVLIAIHKLIDIDKISHSDGYEYIVDLCYREQPNTWQLSKSISEQSPETINFLHKILLNK